MSSGKLISDGVTNSKLVHKTMSLISNDGGRGSREMPSAFSSKYSKRNHLQRNARLDSGISSGHGMQC